MPYSIPDSLILGFFMETVENMKKCMLTILVIQIGAVAKHGRNGKAELTFFCICYTCTQVFTAMLKGLPGGF